MRLAADRHYVMRRNLLGYYAPPHRKRPSSLSFGWIDGAAAGGVAAVIAWYLMIFASPGHSNRDFAGPALLLSFVLSTWGSLRLNSVPLLVRVLCFPVALVIGYLGFGLLMILAAA